MSIENTINPPGGPHTLFDNRDKLNALTKEVADAIRELEDAIHENGIIESMLDAPPSVTWGEAPSLWDPSVDRTEENLVKAKEKILELLKVAEGLKGPGVEQIVEELRRISKDIPNDGAKEDGVSGK